MSENTQTENTWRRDLFDMELLKQEAKQIAEIGKNHKKWHKEVQRSILTKQGVASPKAEVRYYERPQATVIYCLIAHLRGRLHGTDQRKLTTEEREKKMEEQKIFIDSNTDVSSYMIED